jgi:hypothetical protein
VFRAERLFMQLRGGFMTQEEMRKMVAAYFESTIADAEDARADGSGVLSEDSALDGSNEELEGLELHLGDLMEDLARGKHEGVAHVADSILDCAGITLDKGSHEYRVLCREALKGVIAATRIQLERMKGHYPERSEAPMATSPVSAPPPPAAPRVMLSEALAEYVKEHAGGGHWTEKTKAESQGIYALLLGIVGDRDTVELDYKSLAGFRDALTRFPSNVSKKKEFRGKSIPQILKMDIVDPLSVSSVNKHLIRVGAFLKWATRRGYVVANYAEGLTITQRNKKEEEEREAYSKEDLLRLAQSPLAGFRKTHPERYWIPLLGLYTGARLNELCQLYTEDIREEASMSVVDDRSQPAFKSMRKPLLDPVEHRPFFPLLPPDLVGLREIPGEHLLHFHSEFLVQDHRVHLVIGGKTPEVHVGGADGRPDVVDYRGFRMQQDIAAFV